MLPLAPRLFTYCIRHDGGSAPNPYGETCTLAICKPKIRSAAQVGDWIAATASSLISGAPQNRLVYAMKVTTKLSMQEYDDYCIRNLSIKIPRRPAKTFQEFVGDSIYDFSSDRVTPKLRAGVHLEENRETDLGGKFVLLSDHFYYFGDHAQVLPEPLFPIIRSGRGHQSNKNAAYLAPFCQWIENFQKNHIYGDPINHRADWLQNQKNGTCSTPHIDESDDDESNS